MQPWFIDFAEAIDDGEPVYRHCESCGEAMLPPREVCPACGSSEIVDRELSSSATVASYTEITTTIPAFEDETPYTVVLADVEDGVRLTGQLRDADGIAVGDEVTLGVEARGEDRWLVTFRPA